MIDEPLRVGILGDLHGHFNLALTILKRWENETGKQFDLLLQVGDFGVWPYPYNKLDHVTYKFSQKDPDEISFPNYLEKTEDSARFFDEENPLETRIDAQIIFIKGNHEDFDYLSAYENSREIPVPVDYYSKFLYLPNGKIFEFKAKNKKIKIGGLGGIERTSKQGHFTRKETIYLENEKNLDIILTHQPFNGALFEDAGSEAILQLIEFAKPIYHFCGHAHENGQELEINENTKSFILNEVNFRKKYKLNKNCIGILEWISKTENEFNFLDESWLKEYARDSYTLI